jgi:hypothetical protein
VIEDCIKLALNSKDNWLNIVPRQMIAKTHNSNSADIRGRRKAIRYEQNSECRTHLVSTFRGLRGTFDSAFALA